MDPKHFEKNWRDDKIIYKPARQLYNNSWKLAVDMMATYAVQKKNSSTNLLDTAASQ